MSTNMLMNGVNPVGMVYNQSAENIAYDSNNSVKDMIDVKSVNITNQATGLNYVSAFRIGKLVVIEFGLYEASANTTLFTVEQSARPSSNKSISQWLPTNASSFGTKNFTLDSSNGNVICNNEVFRGTVWLIYTI